MTEQEQKAFKMYGKVPAKNLLTKMQKVRLYSALPRLKQDQLTYRTVNTSTQAIT